MRRPLCAVAIVTGCAAEVTLFEPLIKVLLKKLDIGAEWYLERQQVINLLAVPGTVLFLLLFWAFSGAGGFMLLLGLFVTAIEVGIAVGAFLLKDRYADQLQEWVNAADAIEAHLTGGDVFGEWTEFLQNPASDPELEQIRAMCQTLPDQFPPQDVGEYCGPDGIRLMHDSIERLRIGIVSKGYEDFLLWWAARQDAKLGIGEPGMTPPRKRKKRKGFSIPKFGRASADEADAVMRVASMSGGILDQSDQERIDREADRETKLAGKEAKRDAKRAARAAKKATKQAMKQEKKFRHRAAMMESVEDEMLLYEEDEPRHSPRGQVVDQPMQAPPMSPMTPQAPMTPQGPMTPQAPTPPQAPTTPQAPMAPQAPITPQAPTTPQQPYAPQDPHAPHAPYPPQTPYAPQTPYTPQAPAPQAPPQPSYAPGSPYAPKPPTGHPVEHGGHEQQGHHMPLRQAPPPPAPKRRRQRGLTEAAAIQQVMRSGLTAHHYDDAQHLLAERLGRDPKPSEVVKALKSQFSKKAQKRAAKQEKAAARGRAKSKPKKKMAAFRIDAGNDVPKVRAHRPAGAVRTFARAVFVMGLIAASPFAAWRIPRPETKPVTITGEVHHQLLDQAPDIQHQLRTPFEELLGYKAVMLIDGERLYVDDEGYGMCWPESWDEIYANRYSVKITAEVTQLLFGGYGVATITSAERVDHPVATGNDYYDDIEPVAPPEQWRPTRRIHRPRLHR